MFAIIAKETNNFYIMCIRNRKEKYNSNVVAINFLHAHKLIVKEKINE